MKSSTYGSFGDTPSPNCGLFLGVFSCLQLASLNHTNMVRTPAILMCLNQIYYSPLHSAFLSTYPPPPATDIETHRYKHRQKDRQTTERQSHTSTHMHIHSPLLITTHPYTQEELLHVGLSILPSFIFSIYVSSSSFTTLPLC